MPFPTKVQEDVLVACGRHCCLCHKFCGLKIELHHIKQKAEGGEDAFENCIPLCFDCHADMRSYDHKHPKGTKYTPSELFRHRDAWYKKITASPSPNYGAASLELDKSVYGAILKLLPYKGTVSLLQNHSFGAPFRSSIFLEFDRFVLENEDPAMEFIDSDLEGMRVGLVGRLKEFSFYLATNTWRLGLNMQSVPSEWALEQPERLNSVVSKLDAMSSDIATKYSVLVREARRRLGVSSLTTTC